MTEIVRKLTLVDKTNNIFIQPAMAGGGEPMVSESFIKKKINENGASIFFYKKTRTSSPD